VKYRISDINDSTTARSNRSWVLNTVTQFHLRHLAYLRDPFHLFGRQDGVWREGFLFADHSGYAIRGLCCVPDSCYCRRTVSLGSAVLPREKAFLMGSLWIRICCTQRREMSSRQARRNDPKQPATRICRVSKRLWTGSGEDYITKSFMLCIPHQITFGWSSQEDWEGQDMQHVWGREKVHSGF
jgi:hypothetical protein